MARAVRCWRKRQHRRRSIVSPGIPRASWRTAGGCPFFFNGLRFWAGAFLSWPLPYIHAFNALRAKIDAKENALELEPQHARKAGQYKSRGLWREPPLRKRRTGSPSPCFYDGWSWDCASPGACRRLGQSYRCHGINIASLIPCVNHCRQKICCVSGARSPV